MSVQLQEPEIVNARPHAVETADSTAMGLSRGKRARPLFDPPIVRRAIVDSFVKLNPVTLAKNPVMFVVEVGAALTTVLMFRTLATGGSGLRFRSSDRGVAVVHGAVRQLRRSHGGRPRQGPGRQPAQNQDRCAWRRSSPRAARSRWCRPPSLRKGDVCLCEPNDVIPGDGEVIEGIASVDESVITGESAPVIRESGGDRSAVTGGTKVLSDYIKVQITSNPGETFLDRMIALVEGAQRQKTPNEIALNIMIAGLTLIFLFAVVTLAPFAQYSVAQAKAGAVPSVIVLVSLLVCLIPTTIGGLLSAIGIAGMDRVMQHNVLAMSGKAVEAAGDVNTLLLDKTGTITLGNRQAVEFIPVDGVTEAELADAAQLSSLADETPEGRSIVVLAKEKYGLRGREIAEHEAEFIPFTAQTRMSGVNYRRPRDSQGRHGIRSGST